MKDAFKKAAAVVIVGLQVTTMGSGIYLMGETATREYITQKEDYDKAKACIRTMKDGGECDKADYPKVGRMTDNERRFGLGVALVFFNSAVLLPVGTRAIRRMDEPEKDDPKDAPKP